MKLIDALQINYELSSLSIEEVEKSNTFKRWYAKEFSDKLRMVQLKSSELSIEIQHMQSAVNRNIQTMNISQELDANYWTNLMHTMQLQNYLFSRINIPDIPETRIAVERISQQIVQYERTIAPFIKDYNNLIQDLRKYNTRPFNFNKIAGIPDSEELPVVLNISKLSIF